MHKFTLRLLDHWISLSSMSNPVLVFLPNQLITLGFRLNFHLLMKLGSWLGSLLLVIFGYRIACSIRDVLEGSQHEAI